MIWPERSAFFRQLQVNYHLKIEHYLNAHSQFPHELTTNWKCPSLCPSSPSAAFKRWQLFLCLISFEDELSFHLFLRDRVKYLVCPHLLNFQNSKISCSRFFGLHSNVCNKRNICNSICFITWQHCIDPLPCNNVETAPSGQTWWVPIQLSWKETVRLFLNVGSFINWLME